MFFENHLYLLEVDSKHGVLSRLRDKIGKVELITEPRLAENFRLLLPLPKMHANHILGKEQRLSSAEKLSNGIKLHWAGPLQNAQGSFSLAVTLWIDLIGQTIQFRCNVENRTKHKLAEVWYPVLGGMTGIGSTSDRKNTKVLVPYLFSQWTRDLFTNFGTGQCLGIFGGEYSFNYAREMSMPWTSLYNPGRKRAVYFAAHDQVARSKSLSFTMTPGNATQRVGNDWPTRAEANGLPVGVKTSWTFFPYTKPGETFEGASIVLHCHAGGWKEAASLYRTWFDSTFGVVDSRRDWLRQETTTLDTMFLLPEDNINLTYRHIPAWARSAQRRSVRSVLVSGWQIGGHDRGYPQYEPDPRLGTWKELEAAIRACHKMGVRIYFFVNVFPVDKTTEWYRKELHKYVVQDPWGSRYHHYGYGMGTLGARMSATRVPLISASCSIPAVRNLFVRQMRKLAQIGADGVHIDKFVPHTLDFNPLSPLSPDRASWEGMLHCVEEMLRDCRAINPEFTFSSEGWYDRLLTYSDVVWWGFPEHSVMKIAFPEWAPIVGVEQPYSYNVVNLAVLRGHNLLVGPANYQASMDYPPMRELNDYIGEVTRIRRELHDILSRGELLDTSDKLFASEKPVAKIGGSFAKDPNAQWTVFRDAQTGKRAIVLANLGRRSVVAQHVALVDPRPDKCRVFQPCRGTRTASFPLNLTIPAERVIVAAE
jgi:hypothetical protein